MDKLVRLQAALGYTFNDPALLTLALSHRSVAGHNNERLEFLGDSIVNHIIAEALYSQFPKAREGELSRMRASLVKGETLAEIGRELELGGFVILGLGERKSGGHRRSSILADTVEAIAGAILLDSNVEQCRHFVLRWFQGRLQSLGKAAGSKDSKTLLQEFLQGRGHPLPEYELLTVAGGGHEQIFHIACRLAHPALVVEGAGSSRRRAEQAAAAAALEGLGTHG